MSVKRMKPVEGKRAFDHTGKEIKRMFVADMSNPFYRRREEEGVIEPYVPPKEEKEPKAEAAPKVEEKKK